MSSDGTQFVTMGKDRQVRLFRFTSGKLHRKYDESLAVTNKIQKEQESAIFKLDTMEFGRRMTLEKELDNTDSMPPSNVVFDESGNFIMYSTMLGIKCTYDPSVISDFSSGKHLQEQSGEGARQGRGCSLSATGPVSRKDERKCGI